MKQRESEIVDWWNGLPEELRVAVCRALGVPGVAAPASPDRLKQLEIALTLMASPPPPERPH